ncbi:hypothetical protein [Nostoc sp.]
MGNWRGAWRQGDKGDSEDKENNQCPMPNAPCPSFHLITSVK